MITVSVGCRASGATVGSVAVGAVHVGAATVLPLDRVAGFIEAVCV